MNQLRIKLTGLLIAQLVVAAGIWAYAQSRGSDFSVEPLIVVDSSNIDRLVISDEQNSLTLQREDKQWVLPEENHLPANSIKVEDILAKIVGLKTSWPVATTSSSHQRFEVSDDNFQRKIQLYQGDKFAGELYLGSSPGFKKVHLRRAGEQAVYAQNLNTYDFPLKRADWMDKSLLAATNINKIAHNDFTVVKVDDYWQLVSDTEEAMTPNSASVEQLTSALSTLQIMDIAAEPPVIDKNTAINIEVEGDNRWQYQFFKDGQNYFAKRTDFEPIFKLSQFEYQRVAEVTFNDLKATENSDSKESEEPVASNQLRENLSVDKDS